MKLVIELYGETVADLICGLEEAKRSLEVEIILTTGSNVGSENNVKPFACSKEMNDFLFDLKVSNHNKRNARYLDDQRHGNRIK